MIFLFISLGSTSQYGGVTYQLKLVRTGSKFSWVIVVSPKKTCMRTLNILGVSFVLRLSASDAVYELPKVELMLFYNWCFLTDMMIVPSVDLYYMITIQRKMTLPFTCQSMSICFFSIYLIENTTLGFMRKFLLIKADWICIFDRLDIFDNLFVKKNYFKHGLS